MKNRLLVRTLVVVCASLSVVAVGCGATGGAGGTAAPQQVEAGLVPKAPSAETVAKAAATTEAVTSEKFELTVSTAPSDGDPSVSVTSSGEIDGKAGLAHLTANVSGKVGKHSGDATIETIYAGDSIYLKAPFTKVFSDKPWVKVTSSKLADAMKDFDGSLQSDPGSFLTFLEGAGGPVKTLGTEDVRGVATKHVSVQLDVKKLFAKAAGSKRQKIEQHLSQHGISLADVGPLPAEAWIDQDGFVRRLTVSFDLAQLGKVHKGMKATGVITETIELYDFNKPVDVAIPPAAQVDELDLSKLFGN